MVLHQFEQGVVKIGRYPLIFRSEYGKRRRAQLGFDIGMAGKSLDEGANFLARCLAVVDANSTPMPKPGCITRTVPCAWVSIPPARRSKATPERSGNGESVST